VAGPRSIRCEQPFLLFAAVRPELQPDHVGEKQRAENVYGSIPAD